MGCPTVDDLERAEVFALGHTDYAAKWARSIARLIE
jgi:hypothetical protein